MPDPGMTKEEWLRRHEARASRAETLSIALARAATVMDAPAGSIEGDELDYLVELIQFYEAQGVVPSDN